MAIKEADILNQVRADTHLLNPFPGLRAFGFEESHLFFGREGQSDDILHKLSSNRFAAVIGSSGSGKSSLMYCGLIPVLYGGFMARGTGTKWMVISSRPGNAPIENLADAVLEQSPGFNDLNEGERILERTVSKIILQSSSMGLVDILNPIIQSKGEPQNILVMIDQFEELFRFLKAENDEEAANISAAFVNLLLKSVRQSELPIYVAITMRSDFIGDCSQFPELTHIINKSHYLIPQMTRDQQKMAIEGPVAVGGGKIAKRLIQQLLNDVGNNPDQLPIMQHALMRTWNYWIENREENEPIDLRHYVAIGKIEEALSQHANETFAELNKKEREICEVIFKRLTEKGRDNYGVRRSAKISELAHVGNVNENEVIEVVEKFRQPGRSLLMPPATVPLKSDTIVEISHESLMRIWDRLKNWVDEEAESAQMYLRLSEAAAMYQVGRTGLWRPPDLQLALNWQKKQLPTRDWAQRYNPYFERAIVFLETSKSAYENEQRSKELIQRSRLRATRNVAIGMGIATIVVIVFGIFALVQKIEADEKAEEALQNSMEANRQREYAILQANEAKRLSTIAELQSNEALRQSELARRNEELAKNQQLIAERQSRLAEDRRLRAVESERQANDAKIDAQNQAEIAQLEREKADKLRMLSLSQSMAVKSLQITEKNRQGNLAQLAYLFNVQYQGNSFDKYVYDGLYYALKSFKGDSLYTLYGHEGVVRDLSYNSANPDYAYSVGSDGNVYLWNVHEMAAPQMIYKNSFRNRVLKVTRDGRWLIVGGDGKGVQCFDLENKQRKPIVIRGHEGGISDIAMSPNDEYFLTLGDDNALFFNDFAQSSLIKQLNENYLSMAIRPDGKQIALGSITGKVILITLDNINNEMQIKEANGSPVYALSFNPDGSMLAIGDDNGVVSLYDLSKGDNNTEQIPLLAGHMARVSVVEFSDDGFFLASGSFDGNVQVWVMDNINELPMIFSDNSAKVWSIAFSPDGETLIAGAEDATIKIWPTDPETIADQMCNLIERNLSEEEWETYVAPAEDIKYRKTCPPVDYMKTKIE
ncbi:hypothetical protein ACFLU5_05695 [Bacteroidota bacterium]